MTGPEQHPKAWRFPTDDGADYGVLIELGSVSRAHWYLICPATATLYLRDHKTGEVDLLDCHDGEACDFLDDVHVAAHRFLRARLGLTGGTRHPFIDPIAYQRVTLCLDDPIGVEHPGCDSRADVTAELDCFYCTDCGRNGRISGAWFAELLQAVS
jgi:hypothetical protein